MISIKNVLTHGRDDQVSLRYWVYAPNTREIRCSDAEFSPIARREAGFSLRSVERSQGMGCNEPSSYSASRPDLIFLCQEWGQSGRGLFSA
jgi:hypothetical protein